MSDQDDLLSSKHQLSGPDSPVGLQERVFRQGDFSSLQKQSDALGDTIDKSKASRSIANLVPQQGSSKVTPMKRSAEGSGLTKRDLAKRTRHIQPTGGVREQSNAEDGRFEQDRNEEVGSEEDGNEEDGDEEDRNEEDRNEEDRNEEDGNEEDENEDDGYEEEGNEDNKDGHERTEDEENEDSEASVSQPQVGSVYMGNDFNPEDEGTFPAPGQILDDIAVALAGAFLAVRDRKAHFPKIFDNNGDVFPSRLNVGKPAVVDIVGKLYVITWKDLYILQGAPGASNSVSKTGRLKQSTGGCLLWLLHMPPGLSDEPTIDLDRLGSSFDRNHGHEAIRYADTSRDKASRSRSTETAAVSSGMKKSKKLAAPYGTQLDSTAGAASGSKKGTKPRAASGNCSKGTPDATAGSKKGTKPRAASGNRSKGKPDATTGSKTGKEPATVPHKPRKGTKSIKTKDGGLNQDNILKTQLRGQSLPKPTPDQRPAKKTAKQTNLSKGASPGEAARTSRPTNIVAPSSPSFMSAKTLFAPAASSSVTEIQNSLFQDEVKALRQETARKRGKMESCKGLLLDKMVDNLTNDIFSMRPFIH